MGKRCSSRLLIQTRLLFTRFFFSLLEVFLLLLYLAGDPMLFFFLPFRAAESVSFSAAAGDALALLLVKWRC